MVNGDSPPLGKHLRRWRGIRGLSQLDLALSAGVSARHVCFIETGRSQPSRDMVVRLAETLDVPLRDRNALLLAAGYAPRYLETSLSDQTMLPVKRALGFVLRKHEPYPAFVLDRAWNIVLSNKAHDKLLSMLLDDNRGPKDRSNILRLVFDPDLLRPHIVNWNDVAGVLLRRVRCESETMPSSGLAELLTEIESLPGVRQLGGCRVADDAYSILIPVTLMLDGRPLSWFSTIAAFGTPQDITLQELRIECLFPADDATELFVTRRAG